MSEVAGQPASPASPLAMARQGGGRAEGRNRGQTSDDGALDECITAHIEALQQLGKIITHETVRLALNNRVRHQLHVA
jgi:hypothetical protein